MSGPKTKPSEQLAQWQMGVGKEAVGWSEADRAKRDALLQPAIDFYTGAAKGGPQLFASMAPAVTQFSQGEKAAKERIMSEVPRGAGQEFALSQLPIQTSTAVGQTMGQTYLGAFDKLAGLGSGYGSFSLAELGGGLRAGEGAGQTQNTVMQAQAAKKAATMGFLGDMAKAAGGVGAAAVASDRRLKKNIRLIGQQNGHNLYEFSYVWDLARRYVGVMAQEVMRTKPEAVHGVGGWLAVDYEQLGIPFRRVAEGEGLRQ